MAKLREGDLFAIPLPDKDWITGRILLEMSRLLSSNVIAESSPLRVQRSTILVEVFSEPTAEPSDRVSTVLIPGTWLDPDALTGRQKPRWPIVGHRAVDPAEIDYTTRVAFHVRLRAWLCSGRLSRYRGGCLSAESPRRLGNPHWSPAVFAGSQAANAEHW
jgi:hypothetical protein